MDTSLIELKNWYNGVYPFVQGFSVLAAFVLFTLAKKNDDNPILYFLAVFVGILPLLANRYVCGMVNVYNATEWGTEEPLERLNYVFSRTWFWAAASILFVNIIFYFYNFRLFFLIFSYVLLMKVAFNFALYFAETSNLFYFFFLYGIIWIVLMIISSVAIAFACPE